MEMCSSFDQNGKLFVFTMLSTLSSFLKDVVKLPNYLLRGIKIKIKI